MTSAIEFIDEPDTIYNEVVDNGLLATDNRTTELESLSKLKMAGKLRYWRGTIEIPEIELHAICDEIQAEHEQAIAATLGSGTCEYLGYDDGIDEGVDGEWYRYSLPRHFLSCGHDVYDPELPNYCPHCGRKIINEEIH